MTSHLDLIARKLSGEISQEEKATLQEWLDASPQNELLYHRLEDAWHNAKYRPTIQDQEKTYEKIVRQLHLEQKKVVPISRTQSSVTWQYWRPMAAAIFLILGFTVLWVKFGQEEIVNIPTEDVLSIMVSKSNPRGQKSIITLPDGSKVTLNAESYLEYPQDFKQSRLVKLVGEAFFDVVRDTLKPFIVTAGDIQVRVLGTSFNVQAFPFEEDMSVAVASGTVMIEKRKNGNAIQTSQLLPQEMVSINHQNGTFEKSNFDPNELLAWKEGILVFHKASFEEIIQTLERWYGVDFIIQRTQPVTDGFTGRYQNPSLKVILEGMSYSSNFTYHIKGDTVIIE